jgi:hypothetical protein
MQLRLLAPTYAVARLDGDAPLPGWFSFGGPFASATRRDDELSLVCVEDAVPPDAAAERGWRALEVAGPLDFSLTGILASLAAPLADAGVSIFALATHDTDVLLVRSAQLDVAVGALENAGHTIA